MLNFWIIYWPCSNRCSNKFTEICYQFSNFTYLRLFSSIFTQVTINSSNINSGKKIFLFERRREIVKFQYQIIYIFLIKQTNKKNSGKEIKINYFININLLSQNRFYRWNNKITKLKWKNRQTRNPIIRFNDYQTTYISSRNNKKKS